MNPIVACFLVAASGAMLLTEPLRRLALRTGFFDRPGAHKSHDNPTPYLGGVAVAGGTIVAVGFAALVGSAAADSASGGRIGLVALLAAVLGVVGLIDDDRSLRPTPRFAAQFAVAAVLVVTGGPLELTGVAALDTIGTIVGVVAVTNAWNFLDNMDGLCAGLSAVTGAALAVHGAWQGSIVSAALGAALAGAAVGFLPFNVRPAAIYLGDAGSLFTGFLVAATALETAPLTQRGTPVVLAALLLGLPAFDLVVVCLARMRRGISLTTGGRNHFSHRLVAQGASRGLAVAILVAIQAVCSALAVLVGIGTLEPALAVGLGAAVLGVLLVTTLTADVFPEPVIRLPRRSLLRSGVPLGLVLVVAASTSAVLSSGAGSVASAGAAPALVVDRTSSTRTVAGGDDDADRTVVRGRGCAPGDDVLLDAGREPVRATADEFGVFSADVEALPGDELVAACGGQSLVVTLPGGTREGWGRGMVAVAGLGLLLSVVTVVRRRATIATARAVA